MQLCFYDITNLFICQNSNRTDTFSWNFVVTQTSFPVLSRPHWYHKASPSLMHCTSCGVNTTHSVTWFRFDVRFHFSHYFPKNDDLSRQPELLSSRVKRFKTAAASSPKPNGCRGRWEPLQTNWAFTRSAEPSHLIACSRTTCPREPHLLL